MPERIKALRKALKLSQKEFGKRLGVSRDVIGNLEYGRADAKDPLLHLICRIYAVNPQWLENGEEPMFLQDPETTAAAEEALRIFKTLCPSHQKYALMMLKGLAQLPICQSLAREKEEL